MSQVSPAPALTAAEDASRQYHAGLRATRKDPAQAVGWSNEYSQQVRFARLTGVVEHIGVAIRDAHILDVGCGDGALFGWLLRDRNYRGVYQGIDVVAESVHQARQRYAKTTTATASFYTRALLIERSEWDFVVASGLFGLASATWENDLLTALRHMMRLATCAVAFNVLSDAAEDKGDAPVNHVAAQSMVTLVRSVTPWYVLLHDYRDNDMTFWLFHDQIFPRHK
jgi:ubiquinone/menaquinone biosynthesis C-methylase UbiE